MNFLDQFNQLFGGCLGWGERTSEGLDILVCFIVSHKTLEVLGPGVAEDRHCTFFKKAI
jgi:hypothetical protein